MARVITDRIIILLITVIMLAAVSSTAGFVLTDIRIVTGILLLVLILCLSFIIETPAALYLTAAAALIAFFAGFKEISVVYAALSYWNFREDYSTPVRSLMLPLALAGVSFILPYPLSLAVVGLIVISSYISCSTKWSQRREQKLIRSFDDAREQSIRERQRRINAVDRSENEIYLATLKERNRIAREIHDNVGHILTRAVVQMKAISVMNRDEKLTPYLESVDESVNTAMTSIRKSVHELHDESIDLSLGLNDLVNSLDGRFDAKLVTSIESPSSSEFRKAVLGIVKEALTNVSKYSNGDKVKVEVIENNSFWRITVFDNGKNEKKDYLNDAYEGSGIGLENICQRARAFKGTAGVFSDENGFTVTVTIPKEETDDQDTDRG